MSVLLVVATPQEAEFFSGLPARMVVCGIGAVNAALSTLEACLEARPALVLNLGIGGAYPQSGLEIGQSACADALIYAGLGATDGPDFLDLERLGFPLHPGVYNRLPAWPQARTWAERVGIRCGAFLTLETVTGSAEGLARLQERFPEALIEGMEGAGVAHAALRLGIPALELRGVSNFVGPRDRSLWRIGAALHSCRSTLERGWDALEALL